MIHSGASPAALVCAGFRKDDLLVSSSADRPEDLLVLRRTDDNNYSIIRQALSIRGIYITTDKESQKTQILIRLTAPEAVLL
jgi:hypothetical protein